MPREARKHPVAKAADAPQAVETRPIAIAVAAALVVIQLWGLMRYFPLGAWTSPHPFYTGSYALHFARSLLGSTAMARHFRLWSYSPSLMAGYPAGTRTEPMGDAVALWLWLCGGFASVRSLGHAAMLYKLFVVGLIASAPLAMGLSAFWLGFEWPVIALCVALGVFGTFNFPGLLMIRAGMFAFFGCSFLAVAWCALLYDSLDHPRAARLALLAIAGAWLTYLHPLASILILPVAVGALADSARPRQFLALGIAFVAAFVLSLGWLGPVLLTRDIGVNFANWWRGPSGIVGGLRALFRQRLPFPAIVLIALAGYGMSRARLRKGIAVSWGVAIFTFVLITYFGSSMRIFDNLEPGRFEAPFYFFAAPFAALGALEGWRWLGEIRTPFRQIGRTAAVVAVAYFAAVSGASLWVETAYHGPIATELPQQAQELRGWMEVARDSRLVMESGWIVDQNGASWPPYFDSDIGLLWTLESGRETIGASPSEGFSTFGFVDLGNGTAFGRPFSEWKSADFRRQLDIYNVGALILSSEEAKDFVKQVDGAVLLQESDPYALYGVEGDHSFLMAGRAAAVSASQDCIRIKGAEPGRLVLKYHYFRTLRADPPVGLEPVPVGNGDPNPFIEIDNRARRDIRIYNAGFTGLGGASRACD